VAADRLGDRHARSLVVIELAGEPSNVSAVEDILRERVASSGLQVSFAPIDVIDPAVVVTSAVAQDEELAHVWIDLGSPERITFYLVDGKRERVLVRHFARHENPEVAREELGYVVELALVALRAGERIGVGRDVARAELAPEVAAPPPVASPPPAPPFAKLKDKPRTLGAYNELYELSLLHPQRTIAFVGFKENEIRPVDAAMLVPLNDGAPALAPRSPGR
jgi:hypothetical protein